MLDSLITSKTRIRLLVKFFSNPLTKAYLREIADEFGESTNAVRVELNRLSDAKLLISEPRGRTIEYRANKEHPLFPDIRQLVSKYLGLDKIALNIAAKLGKMDAAYIIGDYSRGIDSGLIDLLIVGDNVNLKKLSDLSSKVEKLINRKIRTLVLSAPEFARATQDAMGGGAAYIRFLNPILVYTHPDSESKDVVSASQ
ncbi:MAG: winged helix-turn-helix domain-containing protein [Balneolales bacterium]|nr:winged helix-turn-helix domain-containing protein [Balneolales bacterium]